MFSIAEFALEGLRRGVIKTMTTESLLSHLENREHCFDEKNRGCPQLFDSTNPVVVEMTSMMSGLFSELISLDDMKRRPEIVYKHKHI